MNKQLGFNFDNASFVNQPSPITSTAELAENSNDEFIEYASLPGEALSVANHHNISRPIHYLGSKLRLINVIREITDEVDPSSGPICDLFAGSGTVSKALSQERNVTAVDIQEYSRVLCSALLQPTNFEQGLVDQFWWHIRSSEHSLSLKWAIEPLVAYEMACLKQAAHKDLDPLCDLLENGSLVAMELNASIPANEALHSALNDVISRLREIDLLHSSRALATRYFGGIYFSFSQAAQIDMLLEAASLLPCEKKSAFLAAILSTVSEVVNTVGKQFAQPLRPRSSDGKPKANLVQLVARDRFINVTNVYESWLSRYLAIPKTNRQHQIIRKDFAEALEHLHGQVSIIYADPPYTRDHYSRYYHVLETLCLRDNPRISTVRVNGEERISRGVYRLERHQSPFCIKSQAPKAFSTLFSKARQVDVPLVLSYSPFERNTGARPRLMTIKEIEELAQKFFRRVEVLPAGRIAHNKLNNTEKNAAMSYDAEVLVICEP